jgi:hypothetical protein
VITVPTPAPPASRADAPTAPAPAADPATYRHAAPADLIGREVKAQPFYHVPVPGGARSARAEASHTGRVIEVFGTEMVVVQFGEDAPGSGRQAFFPRELHDPDACTCRACASLLRGPGTHLAGAADTQTGH